MGTLDAQNVGSAPTARKPATVKSATRVLDVIEALAAAPDGIAFSDLARQLQLPKSSLHGLLLTLTDRSYITYDPQSRTYALGVRVWEAGRSYHTHRNLEREAHPVMQRVVSEINETVQLATLDGIENVYLAKVDCTHPLRLQSEVGKRLYAHATGLGKVLLAFLHEDELARRLEGVSLPVFTSNTSRSLEALHPMLKTVRRSGFAVDDQEYTPGLVCVAVPVFDIDASVPVAISASIPVSRAGAGQVTTALRAIASASTEMSVRLGVSQPDARVEALATWNGDALQRWRDESTRRCP